MENRETPLPVRIRRAYRGLGQAQRRVAQYILDRPHQAAFLTTTELGSTVGVSESTVVRLAMSLGYSGYPELQATIRSSLREVLTGEATSPAATRVAAEDASPVKTQMAAEQANLDATIDSLDPESLSAAASLLAEARHVFVIGVRPSFAPAYTAWMLLNRALKRVTLLTDMGGSLRDEVLNMSADDVVVSISAPRYAREALRVHEHAVSIGASTVAVTDSALSPFAEHADVILLFHHLTPSFISSRIGAMAIIHALAIALDEHMGLDSDHLAEDLESVHRHFRLPGSWKNSAGLGDGERARSRDPREPD